MVNNILIGRCNEAVMTAPASLAAASSAEPPQETAFGRVNVPAILVLAVVARALFWNVRPPDMTLFLEPWFNHILRYGPIQAFAHPFSNYEPAYLYLLAFGSLAHGLLATMTIIKILSVAGTVFLTLALAELLKSAGVDRRGALLVLVLPSIVLNDAFLAQCDALWAGACIFALAAIIRGQTLRSMIWCGIAISFKALAVFMAPVIIGAMIGRRAPLWQWAVPALVYLSTLALPWMLGWPGIQLLTVYLDQANLEPLIAGRLANPWMVMTIFADEAARHFYFLGMSAAVAAGVVIGALAKRGWRDPRQLILLGALSGTLLPFLLPKMLERYYFLGDVMTLALTLSFKNKEAGVPVRAVQLGSILSHLTYMYFFDHPYPALGGAVCAAAGIVVMCQMAAPSFNALVADLRSAVVSSKRVA
jgi:hypothetical protein